MHTYWQKQASEPLFPDLAWSRPEAKQSRGKLLIIGGNLHGFAAPAEAYREAEKSGIGTARVLLPDALKKTIGFFLEHAEFAASTPSGSFAAEAFGEIMLQSGWADGVLLAGDLGRNSETAVLLEKFVSKYSGQLTITKDAADYFKKTPGLIIDRADTTFVCSVAQLQKLFQHSGEDRAITFGMGLMQLVEALHEFTEKHPCNIIVKHLDNIFVASAGRVSTTVVGEDPEIWRVSTAAHAAVWWLQNPSNTFEALTASIFESPEQ